jgi:hypothetical protein
MVDVSAVKSMKSSFCIFIATRSFLSSVLMSCFAIITAHLSTFSSSLMG